MFGSFEGFRDFFLRGEDRPLTFLEFTACAWGTGMVESFFYTPFEHLKTKLQTQYQEREHLFSQFLPFPLPS